MKKLDQGTCFMKNALEYIFIIFIFMVSYLTTFYILGDMFENNNGNEVYSVLNSKIYFIIVFVSIFVKNYTNKILINVVLFYCILLVREFYFPVFTNLKIDGVWLIESRKYTYLGGWREFGTISLLVMSSLFATLAWIYVDMLVKSIQKNVPTIIDQIDARPHSGKGKVPKVKLREPYWEGVERRVG